jgi:hypothetical protein
MASKTEPLDMVDIAVLLNYERATTGKPPLTTSNEQFLNEQLFNLQ